MRRLWFALLVAIAGIPLASTPALACTCMGGLPACQQLWMGGDESPPTVFEGTVVSIDQESDPALSSNGRPYPYRKVTFRDVENWIGEGPTWVMTAMGDADCGYRFEIGRRYVVDANRNPANGALRTGLCSQTKPVELATELLAYLKTLAHPSSGGSIFGRVTLDQDRFSVETPSESSRRPLEGVQVRLSGQVERSTLTGPDGRYRFEALPAGEYEVATEIPSRPELAGRNSSGRRPLRIVNAHACASVDVSFAVNGVISGSIVDQDGKPVPSTMVDLRLEVPLQKDQPHYGITPTDALGRFEYSRLPAGRYVVGVNLRRGPARQHPWAPARSEPIDLDAGELRTLPPIVVRRLVQVRVRGLVRFADGRPAANQRVTVELPIDLGPPSFGGSSVTDGQGTFEVELFQDQAYIFSTMVGGERHQSASVTAGRQEPVIVVQQR